MTEAGLDRYGLGQRLYHLHVDAALAATRAEDLIDDAQVQAWAVETRQQLATLYGRGDAGRCSSAPTSSRRHIRSCTRSWGNAVSVAGRRS